MAERHQVVVVGAGFGGLQLVNDLKGAPVAITLIDRKNHHLFQPLLYQVATTVLATSEIAWPIRHLYRNRPEVTTLMASVTGVDTAARTVTLMNGTVIGYGTLVLATGATHAYFGNDQWSGWAPGLKTLEDATIIRRRLLLAFEQAELAADPAAREALETFVIVGAGPTGVELAGMIAELAYRTLPTEFRHIDTRKARVILIEAGPRILAGFSEELSLYAAQALAALGVEVMTDTRVTDCQREGVQTSDGAIASRTIVWAAGVEASPAAAWLGAPADRAGRVKVEPDLSVPGLADVFVIGDTAAVFSEDGGPVPGIAPAAKQQGAFVARVIRARLAGQAPPARFRYRNRGSLATIGRHVAIIDFGRIRLKGWLAWWIWGIAHIYFLIGTRSRFAVAWSWLWIFLTNQQSARLITQRDPVRDDGD